jgi:rhamnosyltransferase
MVHVFIIGSKGIPARYGGFESFVENLTERKKNRDIYYHISCLNAPEQEFVYNHSRCFNIAVTHFGQAKAIVYDLISLNLSIKYIEDNHLQNSIIYILACRIGPFLSFFRKRIKKMNIKIYVNPDGHEWLRSKWNKLIKLYWKHSEYFMVKHADLIVCDSSQIENYILRQYKKFSPTTAFIPYGADIQQSPLSDNAGIYMAWRNRHLISHQGYYLAVGRFVPENNYETIIREFMASNTQRELFIVSNVEPNNFHRHLLNVTDFNRDKRIKFIGTIYTDGLLKKIREKAFAYIHGHEVGGTNPSLLEGLASTKLSLLLDVPFNVEVARDAALYFNKQDGSLKSVIEAAEALTESQINNFERKSKQRIRYHYHWDDVIANYEKLFANH